MVDLSANRADRGLNTFEILGLGVCFEDVQSAPDSAFVLTVLTATRSVGDSTNKEQQTQLQVSDPPSVVEQASAEGILEKLEVLCDEKALERQR